MIYGILGPDGLEKGSCWEMVSLKYREEDAAQKEAIENKNKVSRKCDCGKEFMVHNASHNRDQHIMCEECRKDMTVQQQYEILNNKI